MSILSLLSQLGKLKMPRVDFNFQGYIKGALVEELYHLPTGDTVDVTGKTSEEVADLLQDGKHSSALGDHLYESDDSEIELSDFEAT